ncbi:uncharacterized protein ACRADG_005462 [Cochliomyia hominivorax]
MKNPKVNKISKNKKGPAPWLPTEKQKALKRAQEARKLAWERKRQLEEEANRINIIPPRDLTERQLNWIYKNAQPKIRKFPRPRPFFSRWSKQGPMSRNEWVKFYKWADNKAEPKKLPPPKATEEDSRKKRKKKSKINMDSLVEDIEKLATPKKPREKYEYPPSIKYPYLPKIDWYEEHKPERGRPFEPPKVPMDFQHIELEIDFWSKLRFPIRPAALKYTPSENILELAQPRVTPPVEPHCPIPPKPMEYVAPRKRMSKRQWLEHLKRLEYLASPVDRSVIEIYY